jgi:ribosomal protein L37E
MTGLTSQGRDVRHEAVRFCTHCGVVTDDAPHRVCAECGLGIVLACARDAAPRYDAAFLVVTTDMRVSAASANTEPLFGDPDALVGTPLLDLLRGDALLTRHVARAAMGSSRGATAWVRTAEHGRPRKARITGCGDPPAALVVLS